jgi:hypothetical protein
LWKGSVTATAKKIKSALDKAEKKPAGTKAKLVIGWREVISIPEWGIERLLAKADTGARSSAIDVAQIEELPGDRVRFAVVLDRKKPKRRKIIEAAVSRRTRVKSSRGQAHDRLMVITSMKIGPVVKPIELSLVNRRRMICRVLLGRTALEDDFLVDPQTRYFFDDGKKTSKNRESSP